MNKKRGEYKKILLSVLGGPLFGLCVMIFTEDKYSARHEKRATVLKNFFTSSGTS
jgi:hypothetical protein